ncbi:MAG: TlpA family protein disulfide reductase [Desulforhopalus sp.]
MKKQTKFLFVILFQLVILVLGVQSQAVTPMPQFALTSVRNGEIVDSDSFKGKVLLLTFFATWCPPCVEEVPVLVKLHDELAGSGFSVIGLAVDQQEPEVVANFVEKRSINYPVLLAEAQTTSDFGGVYGIPVAFLVNKSGNVVKRYTGYVQHTVLEKDIMSLLN